MLHDLAASMGLAQIAHRQNPTQRLCLPETTLPETNIFEPENGWLEAKFAFGMAYLQGAILVSFWEGMYR